MSHYCNFCQMEHSSASCFHPSNQGTIVSKPTNCLDADKGSGFCDYCAKGEPELCRYMNTTGAIAKLEAAEQAAQIAGDLFKECGKQTIRAEKAEKRIKELEDALGTVLDDSQCVRGTLYDMDTRIQAILDKP